MRNFWEYFKETWHEGVTLAAGYVVVSAWQSVGLPSATKLATGTARIVYEFALIAFASQ